MSGGAASVPVGRVKRGTRKSGWGHNPSLKAAKRRSKCGIAFGVIVISQDLLFQLFGNPKKEYTKRVCDHCLCAIAQRLMKRIRSKAETLGNPIY